MKPSGMVFWLRFGVFFWVITVVYWVAALGGGAYFVGIPSDSTGWAIHPSVGTIPGNIIGLFVPIGPSNALLFLSGLSSGVGVATILILVALYFTERLLRKLNLGIVIKIFANLGILLLLTASVDYVILGKWASFEVLKMSVEYSNDQYGETTALGTIADFKQALESSDIQKAIKYFELDQQQSAANFFANLESSSTPAMLAADLDKLSVKSSSDTQIAYLLRDSSGKVVIGILLEKNSKGIWKIFNIVFND